MTDAAMTRALTWASFVVFIVLAAITGLVLHDSTFDQHLANSLVLDPPASIAKTMGTVLQPNILDGLGILIAVALFLNKHRRAAIWVVGVLLISRSLSIGLKELVQRDRPVIDHPAQTLSSYAFPSGHVTTAAALAGCIIVIASMLVRKPTARRLVVTAAVAFIVVVGLDRVLLGVHFVSDVVAGALLGALVTTVGVLVFDPRPRSIALTSEPLPAVFLNTNRKLAVVLNPVKIPDRGQFRAMVSDMAAAAGFSEVLWWETTIEDTGSAMAHEAAVAGASLVLSVGGDGTLRAVSDELAGTGIPVGIVPAGTGNLLARNLGIPLYIRAAVDVALNGQDRAIDMVRVSGDNMPDDTFLVMAGMGFDAAIMAGVNENIKKRVGWLAYVLSGLKALMFPAIRLDISIDDAPFTKHKARTVVIGNVGNLQGGMPLMPEARIDDGQIDVVLLYPRRFLSWLPLAARVITKSAGDDRSLTRMRGRTVVVRSHSETPREFDGDVISSGHELRCECVHGRLLVRVPR